MKTYRGSRGIAPRIINLGTLPPWTNPGTHWIWDQICPSACMGVSERRNISYHCRNSNLGSSSM